MARVPDRVRRVNRVVTTAHRRWTARVPDRVQRVSRVVTIAIRYRMAPVPGRVRKTRAKPRSRVGAARIPLTQMAVVLVAGRMVEVAEGPVEMITLRKADREAALTGREILKISKVLGRTGGFTTRATF